MFFEIILQAYLFGSIIVAALSGIGYFIGKIKGLDMKALYGKWFSQLLGEHGVKTMFKSPFTYCALFIDFIPFLYIVIRGIIEHLQWGYNLNHFITEFFTPWPFSLIPILLSLYAGYKALVKGYSFKKYFGISFIITPILSLYAVKRLQITPEAERLAEEQAQQKAQEKLRQAEEAAEAERLQRIIPKQRSGCLSKILLLILIVVGIAFGYKKLAVDRNGTYATQRLTYNDEYGFCVLVSYHPQYRTGNSNGFAIVNIPFQALFDINRVNRALRAHDSDEDPLFDGVTRWLSDNKNLYTSYKLIATYGDNNLIDSLAKLFSDEIQMSTKSYPVGNKGNYFILQASDVGF
jgi:hypothetical protein